VDDGFNPDDTSLTLSGRAGGSSFSNAIKLLVFRSDGRDDVDGIVGSATCGATAAL